MQTTLLVILMSLVTPILSSKILYMAPINASSHHMWHNFFVTELAKRGHQLTHITSQHLKGSLHPNVESYIHHESERVAKTWDDFFHIAFFGTPLEKASALEGSFVTECEEMFKSGPYKALADPRNNITYDVMIMEYAGHDCLLPLSLRIGSPPIILTNPVTLNPHWLFRIAGVPIFPLVPHIADDNAEPSGIWDRLKIYSLYLLNDFDYFTRTQPAMERINREIYGEDVLSLKQLFQRVAVSLVNIPDWNNKIPLPPSVIPVGGIHLAEAKPLRSDLKKLMDEAKDGVILVSFGTLVPTESMAVNTFRNMAAALGQVPQKVIWKWDTHMKDDNITFSENIVRLPWIPQNDILGHPNTRMFVSHCGGQSTLEAMYHGVPVLAIPGFYDQHGNADGLVAQQAALRLNFNDITQENFLRSIQELTGNPKYSEGALRLKNSFRDQPTKPLDRAIFWIEHVIRNKGAPHLRPLLHNLPSSHVLIADIVLATIASVILVAVVFKILLFLLCSLRSIFAKKPKNKSD